MSKFAKFTLIKFVLPTDTSSEEFCTAYYFLHGSLEGKFSVVKSCNTILCVCFIFQITYEILLPSDKLNAWGILDKNKLEMLPPVHTRYTPTPVLVF